ncbi:MAG: T9SS type A sorting domain-containing protein [Bacteroidetes bacterium]|nr:T9SS type A sorting domain-containing protein [Bacteroidota bacterium]
MVHTLRITCTGILCLLTQSFFAQLISLDLNQTYQTIDRWENGAFLPPGIEDYVIDDLVDLAVDSLGINRLRLEVRSGSEYSDDNYQLYQDGDIDYDTWRSLRYATVNDNDDPFTIDWAGFHFTELDEKIENLVIPIRERLIQQEEDLYVNLCFVAFTGQLNGGDGGQIIHQNPEEYAEFIEAIFLHMDNEYGFVPDGVEVILEPNVADFGNATLVGESLVAAGNRLTGIGFQPDFIACSNTNLFGAINFYPGLVAVPGVSDYWSEYSFHAYAGRTTENLIQIADNALASGVKTSMLEWWANGNTFSYLHECLKFANISTYEFTGSFGAPGNDWNMGLLQIVDNGNNDYTLDLQPPTKYFRHYFKLIKPGALRCSATSDSLGFDPVAFVNPDGNLLVNIDADSSGTVQIVGLPTGIYQTIHSLGNGKQEPSVYWEHSPLDTLMEGEVYEVEIPSQGIFSIIQTSLPAPTLSEDVDTTEDSFLLNAQNGMLSISAHGSEKIKNVTVYSLSGQTVLAKSWDGEQVVDLNYYDLGPQIYVVRINQKISRKLFFP